MTIIITADIMEVTTITPIGTADQFIKKELPPPTD